MALWRPYALSDEPLNLSKGTFKIEEVSPRLSYGSPELPPPVQGGYYVTYPDPQHPRRFFSQPATPYTTPSMPYVPPAMPYLPSALPYVPPPVPYVESASPYAASTISPDSTRSLCLTQPKPPSSTESGLHVSDTESLSGDLEYQIFERDAFQSLAVKNGGSVLGSNPKMRRAVQSSQCSNSYRQQRERNNLAAKKSRDRRKLKEIRLAFQVIFLKKKMAALEARMAAGVCARCAGRM